MPSSFAAVEKKHTVLCSSVREKEIEKGKEKKRDEIGQKHEKSDEERETIMLK